MCPRAMVHRVHRHSTHGGSLSVVPSWRWRWPASVNTMRSGLSTIATSSPPVRICVAAPDVVAHAMSAGSQPSPVGTSTFGRAQRRPPRSAGGPASWGARAGHADRRPRVRARPALRRRDRQRRRPRRAIARATCAQPNLTQPAQSFLRTHHQGEALTPRPPPDTSPIERRHSREAGTH